MSSEKIFTNLCDKFKDYILKQENQTVIEQEFLDPMVKYISRKLFPILLTMIIYLLILMVIIAYILYILLHKSA